MLQSTGGHFRYVSYLHDDSGNLARITHPDGVLFTYAYDPIGQPISSRTSFWDTPSRELWDPILATQLRTRTR